MRRKNKSANVWLSFCLFLVLCFLGCSTSSKGNAPTPVELAPLVPPPVINRVNAKAELSSIKMSDGSIILVSVILPKDIPEAQIMGDFEGIELPFYKVSSLAESRYEAVLGVPYGKKPGSAFVAIKISDGTDVSTLVLPLEVVEGDYASETLKAAEKYVKPKPRDQERMKRESVELHATYEIVTRKKFWEGPFVFPIKSDITSRFGTKRVFNGELKSFHTGLDLKAQKPTPIHAAAPGVVLLAKNLFMTGNTVIVDHGYGVLTLYAHMSRIKVKKGRTVGVKTLLGLSGHTGRVSGPHLHWMAIIHKTKVNPLDLTRVMR